MSTALCLGKGTLRIFTRHDVFLSTVFMIMYEYKP